MEARRAVVTHAGFSEVGVPGAVVALERNL